MENLLLLVIMNEIETIFINRKDFFDNKETLMFICIIFIYILERYEFMFPEFAKLSLTEERESMEKEFKPFYDFIMEEGQNTFNGHFDHDFGWGYGWYNCTNKYRLNKIQEFIHKLQKENNDKT